MKNVLNAKREILLSELAGSESLLPVQNFPNANIPGHFPKKQGLTVLIAASLLWSEGQKRVEHFMAVAAGLSVNGRHGRSQKPEDQD